MSVLGFYRYLGRVVRGRLLLHGAGFDAFSCGVYSIGIATGVYAVMCSGDYDDRETHILSHGAVHGVFDAVVVEVAVDDDGVISEHDIHVIDNILRLMDGGLVGPWTTGTVTLFYRRRRGGADVEINLYDYAPANGLRYSYSADMWIRGIERLLSNNATREDIANTASLLRELWETANLYAGEAPGSAVNIYTEIIPRRRGAVITDIHINASRVTTRRKNNHTENIETEATIHVAVPSDAIPGILETRDTYNRPALLSTIIVKVLKEIGF